MDVYVGIDPGSSGYICALEPGSNNVNFMANIDKPIDLYNGLIHISEHYNLKMAMIEDVHSLGTMSAKSNFSFGWNCGLLHTILQCAAIPYDKVQPKAWQKFIGVKTKVRKKGAPKVPAAVRTRELKNEIAAICERLYPHVSVRGPKGGLKDGKSDALMIAHYCSLIYNR